ncbi:transposase [Micromonospora sp. NPDC047812]|uniref:transposase n=1 Tax=Micromonospora sp. NPDC047812 TaxID=3155742 RepID=UPI003456B1DC
MRLPVPYRVLPPRDPRVLPEAEQVVGGGSCPRGGAWRRVLLRRIEEGARWSTCGEHAGSSSDSAAGSDPPASVSIGEWEGMKSAGSNASNPGTAGRGKNCQLGVSLAYASPHGRTLINRELYLPRGRRDNPTRREETGIAASVGFCTKPALGLRMLERAITTGLPARWVTADEDAGRTRSSGPGCSSTRWLRPRRVP